MGMELDQRTPSRTRERFEKALETLRQDLLIAAWQYERWDETLAQHRDWARHWLQATILIEPPDIIRTTYQRLERHEASLPKATPARLSAAVLGERLKQQRQANGWSQIQAAEHFAVNQATWSRIERGRVRCATALFTRLTQWLESVPASRKTRAAATNDTGQETMHA
jgi:DNA-binding XRE family transcriptional regulator